MIRSPYTGAHGLRRSLPAVVVWLAFVLRVGSLTYQSLWRDEVDALRFASRSLPELLQMFRSPGENGPLYFLALRPWLMAAGHSEFALRFPSALAGTLAVPLLYVLLLRLVSGGSTRRRRIALTAALLAATAPYLVWYGQEAKMYATLTALVPLGLWLALVCARSGGGRRWASLFAVTSAGVYVHLLAALVIPVQAAWLAAGRWAARRAGSGTGSEARGYRRGTPRWAAPAAYLAALVLPYLPLVWWQATMIRTLFRTGHAFVPLPEMAQKLLVAYTAGILTAPSGVVLFPALLALLAGLAAGAWPGQRGDRTAAGLLAAWLALPPLALYLVSLLMPLYLDRYLIWILPAMLGLQALGIEFLRRSFRRLGAVTLGVLLALNLGLGAAQAATPIKSDFRAAARLVAERGQAGDALLFQMPSIQEAYRYYASGPGTAGRPGGGGEAASGGIVEGPYTNSGMSQADVAAYLAGRLATVEAVWLIASDDHLWDERGLTREWLDAHGQATDRRELARVSVTRYKLR